MLLLKNYYARVFLFLWTEKTEEGKNRTLIGIVGTEIHLFIFFLSTPPPIVLYDVAIKEDALRDSAKWGVGSVRGIEQGILQLRTQALPARRRQLFSEQSEVPGPQPQDAGLHFGALEAATVDPKQSFVELVNHNTFAVDISGWFLSGGGIRHTMKPGTVLAPGMSLVVVGWGFINFFLSSRQDTSSPWSSKYTPPPPVEHAGRVTGVVIALYVVWP